jgi:hypothetical protein
VDYSLLAHALASGQTLTDSATVAAALEPDRILLLLRIWHDSLVARRPGSGRDPDSLFTGDSLRVFQQVLLRIRDLRDAAAMSAVRGRADSVLSLARGGADFTALARQWSEDPTAMDGGFLPVARRGMLLPELERAAWRLGPGEVAGVISRVGLHVVRRPLLAEARDRLRAFADSAATRAADAAHADSLRTAARFTVADDAVNTLRLFFRDPATRSQSSAPLATWDGGALTLSQAALWIDLLPPASFLNLMGASDLVLEGFVRDVALQYLLLAEAGTHDIQITPSQWAGMVADYRRVLRESLSLLGLSDSVPVLPAGEAGGRVVALLDGLTSDRVRWQPLPSGLASVLRERHGYRLHAAGLDRATRIAREN